VDYLYDMVPERTKKTEMAAQAAKPIERWTANPRVALVVSILTGCGKTLWARRNFTGPHVWDNRSTPRRMLKKARLLTRPTLARLDAPYPMQGRSERRGEAYASVR
jgi:hypothetical protein